MNRKAGLSLVITLVVLASVISSSVAQSVNPPLSSIPLLKQTKPGDKLSFRLEALNSSAALRLLSTEEQARLLSLPAQGAGSLMRNLSGELLVEIRVRGTSDAVLQELHQAGAQIVNIAAPYKTVTAFVDTASLTPLADIPEVESIQEELTPMTSGLQVQTQSISRSQAPSLLCPHGNIATEEILSCMLWMPAPLTR